MRFSILVLFLVWMICPARAQEKFTVACLAFYNLENLFDTLDSPDTDDYEFTPGGPNVYNTHVYYDKLSHLARVISEVGTEYTPDGAAIIGVSEIENISVLQDLVAQPALRERHYQIIHQDSKDGRGVDVALLYQPKYFIPDTVRYVPLPLGYDKDSVLQYSRDILFAFGRLNGEPLVVSVNHWPSRRGGEKRTAGLRNAAAKLNRCVVDEVAFHLHAKMVVMGDLNDDPINDSVKKFLLTERNLAKLDAEHMYNPFEEFYRKGIGTTAYQNAWSLFDQIILNHELAASNEGYRFYKAGIYSQPYMKQQSGTFAGYPLRTYSNGQYAGGYSDHFPVYVLVVKPQ